LQGRPVSGLERAAGLVRNVLPHLLRLLPLLEGNIGSAISNLLVAPAPAAPPPPPVNLDAIEDGLATLHGENLALRAQLAEQNATLSEVVSRLEMAEDAAAHSVLAQQELQRELVALTGRMEELKAAGRRARTIAIVALVLAAVSIAAELLLTMRVLHLPR